MGLEAQLNDPDRILRAATNITDSSQGRIAELKIFFSHTPSVQSSTQGYGDRYIWDHVFISFFDLNSLRANPV